MSSVDRSLAMFLGPFVTHRLLSGSRKASTYFARSAQLFVPLFFIGGIWIYWDVLDWGRYTTVALSMIAHGLLLSLIAGAAIEMPMIWSLAAIAIPQERDRKTIDALLSTRLSSFEIVLGLMMKTMVAPLEAMLAVLPIAGIMIAYWGFDPREWLLLNLGLLSTMFLLVAFGLSGSLSATTISRSTARVVSISLLWLMGPFTCLMFILPRLPPAITRALYPIMIWGLDSSPMGLLVNAVGMIRRGSFIDATLRMITLEFLLALILLAWTVFRLRAASRAVDDSEGRLARALKLRFSPRKRWPACGEDPIFWRERFSTRNQSRFDRWSGNIIMATLLAGVLWATYFLAKPALQEVRALGYWETRSDLGLTGLDLFVEAYLRGKQGPPPLGMARPEFNMAIRIFSPMIHLIVVFVSIGLAAESLTTEQKRDTWLGLTVTPLSGEEILRGKMLGVIWKTRPYLILLLGLWSIGVVSGAVHPVGFIASVIGLATSCWFSAALGLYVGLYTDVKVRQLWAIPYFLLLGSSVLIFVPFSWGKSIALGFGSMTFLTFLSLFSFDDLRLGLRTDEFMPIHTYGMNTGGGFTVVCLTCLAGWIAQTLAGFYFHRAAIRDFEKVAGRPTRSQIGENLATVPLCITGTASV